MGIPFRLPRSLDPLPGESLPGYVMRLAHRLGISPFRLGQLTGLAEGKGPELPAYRMFALEPDRAEYFSSATGLTIEETDSLTISGFARTYPPARLGIAGRQRGIRGVLTGENWLFSSFSRYCPQCLAGDGSQIQQKHGGAWQTLWRLPIMFACGLHDRFLAHICPQCGQPALARRSGAPMIPRQSASDFHPTACRSPAPDPAQPQQKCRHLLNDISPLDDSDRPHSDLLELQAFLLTLLQDDQRTELVSAGQPASAPQYFTDLRILAGIACATWPSMSFLINDNRQANAVGHHVEGIHRKLDQTKKDGQRVRDARFYDQPPAASTAGAALLDIARTITNLTESETSDLLAVQYRANPRITAWCQQFIEGDGYCSPGLHAAIDTCVGKRGSTLPAPDYRLQPRPRQRPQRERRRNTRFGPEHIPLEPLPAWSIYLAPFHPVSRRMLNLAVAANLVRATVGTSLTGAARFLGITQGALHTASSVVNRHLSMTGQHQAFQQAIAAITAELNQADYLINYGMRRKALDGWTLPKQDWLSIAADTRNTQTRGSRPARYPDKKRLLCTIWLWARTTNAHYTFSPLLRTPSQDRRRLPGSPLTIYAQHEWGALNNGNREHYRHLSASLNTYQTRLADRLDAGFPAPEQQ